MFYKSRNFTTLFLCIIIVFINSFQKPAIMGMIEIGSFQESPIYCANAVAGSISMNVLVNENEFKEIFLENNDNIKVGGDFVLSQTLNSSDTYDSSLQKEISTDDDEIKTGCKCKSLCCSPRVICNKIKSHPCLSAFLGTMIFGGIGVVIADAATDHAIFEFIENLF